MSAIGYHETIWSDLFAGNETTLTCLQPAVRGVEFAIDLSEKRRRRTIYRLDGGSGSDENLRWLLKRGYHIIAKGFSGKRAHALATKVLRWDAYHDRCFLGSVASPVDFGRPVQVMVKKWRHRDQWKHSYFVTTLTFSSKQAFMYCHALCAGGISGGGLGGRGEFHSAKRWDGFGGTPI